jgi:apolipoprotein N-acyltransferase
LISSQGETLVKYNKLHLVPFGEYIPLKKIFPFLETIAPIGDIRPGQDYTIFALPGPQSPVPSLNAQTRKRTNAQTKFAVLICFEDLFPELARNFVKKGAQFLVNITNDAWYRKTSAPYQHLQASVFRAVENRVSLARAANTGVSGFITPNGKIISLVCDRTGRNIFIEGYKDQEIAIIERRPTFYTRYGDVFIVVCFLFLLYDIIHNLKNITKNVKLKA